MAKPCAAANVIVSFARLTTAAEDASNVWLLKVAVTRKRESLLAMARRDNLTIRQLYMRVTGAAGHLQMHGTASDVADQMLDWVDNEACDGFNIMAPYHPGGLTEFLDTVVPELQRRGRFRTEYDGKTLRENLGLRRVEHRRRRLEAAE